MTRSLGLVSLLVREYDEAIAFFTSALCFTLHEDSQVGQGKRWVVVGPVQGVGAALLLAKASNEEQLACVGRQMGGRVGFFLETDDFWRDHAHMLSHGVRFTETPRDEIYATVAVFLDLYGNKWDLLQPKPSKVA